MRSDYYARNSRYESTVSDCENMRSDYYMRNSCYELTVSDYENMHSDYHAHGSRYYDAISSFENGIQKFQKPKLVTKSSGIDWKRYGWDESSFSHHYGKSNPSGERNPDSPHL